MFPVHSSCYHIQFAETEEMHHYNYLKNIYIDYKTQHRKNTQLKFWA